MTSTPSLVAASLLALTVAASGSAAAATITPRNAPDGAGNVLFPIDSGTGALGFYAAYEASGLTPGAPYSMGIVVPPGQAIAIDDHEPACYNLDFEPGQRRTAFFFLNYIGATEPRGPVAMDQRIDVDLFGTSDCTGAVIDRSRHRTTRSSRPSGRVPTRSPSSPCRR